MSKAIARDPIYRRRRFEPEIIELCVRSYLTYRLSYRELVEMMAERGVVVSHSTMQKLVARTSVGSRSTATAPELTKRCAHADGGPDPSDQTGKRKTVALETYPVVTSIGPDHATNFFVTYSPTESIRRR
jgi:hypothetical protein